MKSYKEYAKRYIGTSCIASLILVGCKDNAGVSAEILKFGKDASYDAYVCDSESEVGKHYSLVTEFAAWMKVYDDSGLVTEFRGTKIQVYRAAEQGCIIKIM